MPGGYVHDIGPAHDDADTGDTVLRRDLTHEETGSADQKYRSEREHGMDRDRPGDSIA